MSRKVSESDYVPALNKSLRQLLVLRLMRVGGGLYDPVVYCQTTEEIRDNLARVLNTSERLRSHALNLREDLARRGVTTECEHLINSVFIEMVLRIEKKGDLIFQLTESYLAQAMTFAKSRMLDDKHRDRLCFVGSLDSDVLSDIPASSPPDETEATTPTGNINGLDSVVCRELINALYESHFAVLVDSYDWKDGLAKEFGFTIADIEDNLSQLVKCLSHIFDFDDLALLRDLLDYPDRVYGWQTRFARKYGRSDAELSIALKKLWRKIMQATGHQIRKRRPSASHRRARKSAGHKHIPPWHGGPLDFESIYQLAQRGFSRNQSVHDLLHLIRQGTYSEEQLLQGLKWKAEKLHRVLERIHKYLCAAAKRFKLAAAQWSRWCRVSPDRRLEIWLPPRRRKLAGRIEGFRRWQIPLTFTQLLEHLPINTELLRVLNDVNNVLHAEKIYRKVVAGKPKLPAKVKGEFAGIVAAACDKVGFDELPPKTGQSGADIVKLLLQFHNTYLVRGRNRTCGEDGNGQDSC